MCVLAMDLWPVSDSIVSAGRTSRCSLVVHATRWVVRRVSAGHDLSDDEPGVCRLRWAVGRT